MSEQSVSYVETGYETIEVVEEPVVVCDGSEQDTVAQPGDAFAGNAEKYEISAKQMAFNVVGNYADQDEDGTWVPSFEMTIQEWAALDSSRELEDAMSRIQGKLIAERCRKRDAWESYLGSCSLDLDAGSEGRLAQDMNHPHEPAICFYEIRRGSALFDRESRRAMAVWYQPELESPGIARNPRFSGNRWWSNDKYEPGYWGIVEFFPSLSLAKEALAELIEAVHTIARETRDAAAADRVRAALYEDDESEDRANSLRTVRDQQPF